MNKFSASLLVGASALVTLSVGAFVLAYFKIDGNLPKAYVCGFACAVGRIVYRSFKDVFNTPTAKEVELYPIENDNFPIDHMFIGDEIKFTDGRTYSYTGRFEGSYGFDGAQYLEMTQEELMRTAIRLSNERIVKWERSE